MCSSDLDKVGERFGRFIPDEGLATFGDNGFVKVDGLLEVWMHEGDMVAVRLNRRKAIGTGTTLLDSALWTRSEQAKMWPGFEPVLWNQQFSCKM